MTLNVHGRYQYYRQQIGNIAYDILRRLQSQAGINYDEYRIQS